MRKLFVVLLAVAIMGSFAPAAWAQAPAPKVEITGLFDQITSMSRNLLDGNYARTSDREWYARTRFRPDFAFSVGRTKAVLGLEIDICYGQGGPNDGGFPGNVSGAAGGAATGVHPGCNGGADINTDLGGMIEIKWMYTEFDLTGKDSLMPFIPVSTVARAGLQPFATLGNYKIVYANGDFAGISMVSTFAPILKTNVTFVQVEEETPQSNRGATSVVKPTRGDDFALIFSVDWTLFKGFDFKPMYSYFFGQGLTSGSSRRGVINVRTASAATTGAAAAQNGLQNIVGSVSAAPALGSCLNAVGNAVAVCNGNGNTTFHESRHTIGFDSRWRFGPLSLDPTLLYQWGSFDTLAQRSNGSFGKVDGDINAWLLDIQAGYQLGPLLLEARYIYSTGNGARDNVSQNKRYFEPLDLDTSYYAGWANILALGVDYFNGGGGNNGGMDTGIGYDRYGRNQFGLRGTYNLTPALAFYTVVSPTWTAQEVDTKTGTNGTIRTFVSDRSFTKGNSAYIGTEWDLGMTWRFAPNAAFDLVGAWLFAGDALDITECTNGVAAVPGRNVNCPLANTVLRRAQDAYTAAARVRLSF